MSDTRTIVYERLYESLGPQHWWPGESPLEVMIGAVLVQNTNWKNVERAIDNLRQADLLDPHALFDVPVEELEELIRPAGYYRVKARRLHSLIEFFATRYEGSIETMRQQPIEQLRYELLGVHGIGPETADSILLYACELPVFVVDTYTHRIFTRHGWLDFDADYETFQDYFQSGLPADVAMYNEYHALLVRIGNRFCRKTNPKCDECPLADMLLKSGPLEPGF